MSRFLTTALITVAVLEFILLIGVAVLHIVGNGTTSMPRGFYRITHQGLGRGEIVVTHSLLKRVAGMPGDDVSAKVEGSYINGKLIPNSAPKRPYAFYGHLILTPGWYWLLGESADSWDSRYFGPVPLSDIASTAQPLWTER